MPGFRWTAEDSAGTRTGSFYCRKVKTALDHLDTLEPNRSTIVTIEYSRSTWSSSTFSTQTRRDGRWKGTHETKGQSPLKEFYATAERCNALMAAEQTAREALARIEAKTAQRQD